MDENQITSRYTDSIAGREWMRPKEKTLDQQQEQRPKDDACGDRKREGWLRRKIFDQLEVKRVDFFDCEAVSRETCGRRESLS